jgi:hypothetical protein
MKQEKLKQELAEIKVMVGKMRGQGYDALMKLNKIMIRIDREAKKSELDKADV